MTTESPPLNYKIGNERLISVTEKAASKLASLLQEKGNPDGALRLKVVGGGPEAARLRALAGRETDFLGPVDDVALRDLYRGCRAVVMASVEDFGIVPLEAMACGRPAVVFAEGGGRETVLPGQTGVLFQEPTAASLRAAVDSLEGLRFNTATLRAHAEAHSRQVFEARFRAFVEEVLADGFAPTHSHTW